MQDRYAEGRFLPPIDSSQDWFLVRGEEEEGTTVLEFTRNLTTCDDKDLNIEVHSLLKETYPLWLDTDTQYSAVLHTVIDSCRLL